MSVVDEFRISLQNIQIHPTKKDFIKLYLIFEKHDFLSLFEEMEQKYSRSRMSLTYILKTLIYFEDAELEPMPRLHSEIEWEAVKERMGEVVRGVSLQG